MLQNKFIQVNLPNFMCSLIQVSSFKTKYISSSSNSSKQMFSLLENVLSAPVHLQREETQCVSLLCVLHIQAWQKVYLAAQS